MRRVMIGTPSHKGELDGRYAASLAETIGECALNGIVVEPRVIMGCSVIQCARNDFVKYALDEGFHDLVFIDDDQDWRGADFLKLLNYPVDCVGAAVRKKTDRAEQYNIMSTTGTFRDDGEVPGLIEVEGLGTGFLRLSRRALQVLWDSSEPYRMFGGKVTGRWIFDIRPIDGDLMGEDVFMALKLRAAGIDIHCDPHIIVGHTGKKRWVGDFAKFIKYDEKPEDKADAA